MINFFNLYDILGFFTTLWFVCWIIILVGSFKSWKNSNWLFLFGFVILYLIIYPIYKRWDKYFSELIFTWPNLEFCIFMLILLIIFWIILFLKLLPEIVYFFYQKKFITDKVLDSQIIRKLIDPHINEESKIKKWLENLSLLWSSWVNLICELPGLEIPFEFLVKNLPKYLDTEVKILWFFGLTIYLPRILTLFALFYDIFILNELYWFPKIALLLTISVLTKMCLTVVEKGAQNNYELITSMTTYKKQEKKFFSENIQKQLEELFSENVLILDFKIKEEFKSKIDQEGYDLLFSDYLLYGQFLKWFDITTMLLDSVFKKFWLLFITGQIIAQITIILNNL